MSNVNVTGVASTLFATRGGLGFGSAPLASGVKKVSKLPRNVNNEGLRTDPCLIPKGQSYQLAVERREE